MGAIRPEDFDFIRALVQRVSAIVLEPGKEYLVESRLGAVLEQQKLSSIEQLVRALRAGTSPELQRSVIEAMTTNETYFFRDVNPFDALRNPILPELLKARASQRRLRIWSAACSSGQEPYTIAMVLSEGGADLSWDVKIVATDLSREMLNRTQRGAYSQLEVNRGLPAPMLVKYFTREGSEWVVKDELRKRIDVRELNLLSAFPFDLRDLDLVFLRNVLIYFEPDTKRAILKRVRALMRPDSWLFLGGAETTIGLDDGFERVQYGKAVCYRPRPTPGGTHG